MPESNRKHLGSLQLSASSELRITLVTRSNAAGNPELFVDIRTWLKQPDGDLIATKKGIHLRASKFHELLQLMQEAEASVKHTTT